MLSQPDFWHRKAPLAEPTTHSRGIWDKGRVLHTASQEVSLVPKTTMGHPRSALYEVPSRSKVVTCCRKNTAAQIVITSNTRINTPASAGQAEAPYYTLGIITSIALLF